MPELPDVEVYRRYLNSTSLNQRIEHIHVESPSILYETTPQGLGYALKHKSFRSTKRHGKYLFVATGNEKWLIMHFGMTGDVKYFKHETETPDYTQFLITFENGFHLAYVAPRKLGRIALTDSPQTWIKEHELGPDAFDLTEEEFVKQAAKRRGGVKSWLMDQTSIAGIGNIYSDEILFQAGIHPRRSVSSLDKTAWNTLYKAMRDVLEAAISAGASTDKIPSTFLLPHRKQGGRCPRCDTPVEAVKAAGRTAWYCPRCQDN